VQLALQRESGATPIAAALSFAEVYTANARYIWQSLRRLGVAPTDLEDVCQEVFVVVHRKLASFDGRSQLRTWLYGIALRCASSYRRSRARREVPTRELEALKVDPGQIESLEKQSARAMLDAVLDTLDEDKRAVFVLYELEELPMSEVAEAVGCPLQTAYSRLHAARHKVEQEIARLAAKERIR
jgi:RNA polymerase sigma-70 factor (ECF subfamily)